MTLTYLRLLAIACLCAASASGCQGSSTSALADATGPGAPAGLNDPDAAANPGGKSRKDCNGQQLAWIALDQNNDSVCAGPLTAPSRPCCVTALKARYPTYGYLVDQAVGGGYTLYNCEQLPTGTTAHFEVTPGDGSRGYMEVTLGDPQPLGGTGTATDLGGGTAVLGTDTAGATSAAAFTCPVDVNAKDRGLVTGTATVAATSTAVSTAVATGGPTTLPTTPTLTPVPTVSPTLTPTTPPPSPAVGTPTTTVTTTVSTSTTTTTVAGIPATSSTAATAGHSVGTP